MIEHQIGETFYTDKLDSDQFSLFLFLYVSLCYVLKFGWLAGLSVHTNKGYREF